MKYTPKFKDKKLRLIYAFLFIITAVCLLSPAQGLGTTILSSVALITIVSASYIFIKYEITLFTYILIERATTVDFYVEKRSGKRGAYVCYYPTSDIREIVKVSKDSKASLKEKYKNIYFFNYSKNVFCGEKYYIVFENQSRFDAVMIEPDEAFLNFLNSKITKADS